MAVAAAVAAVAAAAAAAAAVAAAVAAVAAVAAAVAAVAVAAAAVPAVMAEATAGVMGVITVAVMVLAGTQATAGTTTAERVLPIRLDAGVAEASMGLAPTPAEAPMRQAAASVETAFSVRLLTSLGLGKPEATRPRQARWAEARMDREVLPLPLPERGCARRKPSCGHDLEWKGCTFGGEAQRGTCVPYGARPCIS